MKIVTTGLLAALLVATSGGAYAQIATTATNTWLGTYSSDWGDPGNWSHNAVPDASENVEILGPGQAIYSPYLNGSATLHDLTLSPGSALMVQNRAVLTVYGNIMNNNGALLGVGRGTVALRGDVTQVIGGTTRTQFRNLSVGKAGATTEAPVSVEGGLTVQGRLHIGKGQNFTLLSTAIGPGYVVSDGGQVDGMVSVERYIDPSLNPGLGYRHLSAPVLKTTFATLQSRTFGPVFNTAYNTAQFPGLTQPYPTVYGYDQSRLVSQANAQGLSDFDKGYYSPQVTDAMAPGMGYAVNVSGAANGAQGQGRVVTFRGYLTDGDLTVPVARGPQAGQGWHLLGNPYPSPLDWDRVIADPNTQGINTALYVYKSSGQYAGNWASYVNGVGANGGTNVLPLGQGFFVYSAAAAGQVAFTNSQRLTSDSTLFQRAAPRALLGTRLLLSGKGRNCEAVVAFTQGASNGLDAAYDAVAVPVGALRVTTLAGPNEQLAVNGLPVPVSPVTVPLSLSAEAAGTYQLSRTEGTLPAGFSVYLLDAQTAAVHNLSTGAAVSLTLAAGTSTPGRFSLLFSPAAPLATAQSFAAIGASLYPNPATGSVFVQLGERTGAATVEITNMLGQSVLRREVAGAGGAPLELPLTGLTPGVYSVRLRTATGQHAQRLIVK